MAIGQEPGYWFKASSIIPDSEGSISKMLLSTSILYSISHFPLLPRVIKKPLWLLLCGSM